MLRLNSLPNKFINMNSRPKPRSRPKSTPLNKDKQKIREKWASETRNLILPSRQVSKNSQHVTKTKITDLPYDILDKIIKMVYDSYILIPKKYVTSNLNMEKLKKILSRRMTDQTRSAITLNNYRNAEQKLNLRNISNTFKILLEPYTHSTRKRDQSFIEPVFICKNCGDKGKEHLMQPTKTLVVNYSKKS
jgi:hypothetical protein